MKIKKQDLNSVLLGIIVILLLVNIYEMTQLNKKIDYFQLGSVTKTKQLKVAEKGAKDVDVDFYVMSYCPYGNIAEEALEPVYQLLGDKVNFNPRYIFYSNYRGGGPTYCIDSESIYCSMHGVQEANQDIRELCVDKYMGTDNFFEFTIAMNQQCNSGNADTCWKPVAESLGLDTAAIQKCEEEEALELAAKELDDGNALGVRGSPSVFINNEPYSGPRTAAGYKQAICAEFASPPEECGETITADVAAVPVEGSC